MHTTTTPSRTNLHAIDEGTARYLSAHLAGPAEGTLTIAKSPRGAALTMERTTAGYVLTSSTARPDDWADLFGVLPYKAGRVAVATSRGEPSTWDKARARVLQSA